MGVYFTDQFSLLHFATGVIVYYWDLSIINWFIIHALYEYLENTEFGIWFINNLTVWPGGRKGKDSLINMIGDQFYGLLGWLFTYVYFYIFYSKKSNDIFQKN